MKLKASQEFTLDYSVTFPKLFYKIRKYDIMLIVEQRDQIPRNDERTARL